MSNLTKTSDIYKSTSYDYEYTSHMHILTVKIHHVDPKLKGKIKGTLYHYNNTSYMHSLTVKILPVEAKLKSKEYPSV